MVFSLQKRFLLLLLLPVSFIVILLGGVGWYFARNVLLNQWTEWSRLRLDKASHQIGMRLDEKLELVKLIAKSEEAPDNAVLQTFLIQQLLTKEGVKFVDLENLDKNGNDMTLRPGELSFPAGEGLYTMELCGDYGFCAPIMDPDATDRSLNIVRVIGEMGRGDTKRLTVRIDFNSFLAPLREMELLSGNTAVLVTSAGQLLAATDKSWLDRRKLGENGSMLELDVLNQIRHKQFGTVFSSGHPPHTVVGFHKMPFINWYLLLFSKGSVIMKPIVQFRNYYSVIAVSSLFIIMLLIRLTTARVAESVGQIATAAQKVREGNYTVTLPENRKDEIGALSAAFKNMITDLAQKELIERTFGRYVDKKIAQELLSRPEALNLGGEKRVVTIMMSDLRNFTPVAEKLPPEAVIRVLNRYFSRMIKVIEDYRGIIVDFFGDSILVFFDGLEADVSARALDAILCGLEMQEAVGGFLEENRDAGLPPLTMGIGIHTGEVIVGNIGAESRAKYGIVGAAVNLTDRIQAAASGGKVIISGQTHELLKDQVSVGLEFKVCLKGVEDDKSLYEVASVRHAAQRTA